MHEYNAHTYTYIQKINTFFQFYYSSLLQKDGGKKKVLEYMHHNCSKYLTTFFPGQKPISHVSVLSIINLFPYAWIFFLLLMFQGCGFFTCLFWFYFKFFKNTYPLLIIYMHWSTKGTAQTDTNKISQKLPSPISVNWDGRQCCHKGSVW